MTKTLTSLSIEQTKQKVSSSFTVEVDQAVVTGLGTPQPRSIHVRMLLYLLKYEI